MTTKNSSVLKKLDYYLAYVIRHIRTPTPTSKPLNNHTPPVLIKVDYPLAYDTSDHPIRSQTKKKKRKKDEKMSTSKGKKNDDSENDKQTRTRKATKKWRRNKEKATTSKAIKKRRRRKRRKNYPLLKKLDYYLAYDTTDHRQLSPEPLTNHSHRAWTNSTYPLVLTILHNKCWAN